MITQLFQAFRDGSVAPKMHIQECVVVVTMVVPVVVLVVPVVVVPVVPVVVVPVVVDEDIADDVDPMLVELHTHM